MNDNKEPTTTSLIIAKEFGKQHDDILKSIRNLKCSENFRLGNFTESSYINTQNREMPMFEIKKDGFMFLVMGFSGEKAAIKKEKFINAFNDMFEYIKKLESQKQTETWLNVRFKGKLLRVSLTDEIKTFIEYAESQGSQHANNYYMLITKLVNRTLFGVDSLKKINKNLRDYCDFVQLANITTAESIILRTLAEDIDRDLPYKEIYKHLQSSMETYQILIPESIPTEIEKTEYNKCLSKRQQQELENKKLNLIEQ